MKVTKFEYKGMRRDTMDSNDDRVRDLPPRGHQGGQGGSVGGGSGNSGYGGRQGGGTGGGGRGTAQRRDRRDDRRRTTDDEDTVLDSQDVSSIDRGKKKSFLFPLHYRYRCVSVLLSTGMRIAESALQQFYLFNVLLKLILLNLVKPRLK